MRIEFTVEGMPQGKARPRFRRLSNFVQTYTPEKTVYYEEEIASAAKKAMGGKPFPDVPVTLHVTAVFPVPKRFNKEKSRQAILGYILPTKKPDVDNILKVVGDALNGVCWRDDAMIVEAVIAKRYGEEASLIVTVIYPN